jgi:hypothetical protein
MKKISVIVIIFIGLSVSVAHDERKKRKFVQNLLFKHLFNLIRLYRRLTTYLMYFRVYLISHYKYPQSNYRIENFF